MRWLLAPLSLLFGILVTFRTLLYRFGWRRSSRLPVPVVVVGNISVGGAGKTPLTLALVKWLQDAGYRPGIISRGYGGRTRHPMPVMADSDPGLVGDEPVLLALRSRCPVWVARERVEAGRRLLVFHPEVDVLVADDGLQHYALARDFEVAVVDGQRGLGNGWLLPAGPLRESARRLRQVDAVVLNGGGPSRPPLQGRTFGMNLRGERFRNLLDPARVVSAAELGPGPLHALAAIGHPQRFFDHLSGLGIACVPHPFPDHHVYTGEDLPSGTLLMTEKDAVKISTLAAEQGLEDCWVLAVDAELEPELKGLMLATLNELRGLNHGPQAA